VDISVSKTTRITEHQSFQIRLDMFDMSNTRNFGIPEARISDTGFAVRKARAAALLKRRRLALGGIPGDYAVTRWAYIL
jgi:hypothetical protein